jgi:hypothetical protein
VEKQRGEHVHDINELKRQWETTLREWEEQLAKAQKEIEVIPAAACDYIHS